MIAPFYDSGLMWQVTIVVICASILIFALMMWHKTK